MHLLLTDRLTCPRCGPEFGLILLARRMGEERRVIDGELGCPNCRDAFPVRRGFGDLRAPPRGELPTGRAGAPRPVDPAEAERLQALLGVVEGPGTLLLHGQAAPLSAALAGRIEGIEVVGVDADLVAWPDAERVSRLVARPGLPFFSRTLRGAVVDAGVGTRWVTEGARVLARMGRLVVLGADDAVPGTLEEGGLKVLAREAGTVVAARG